MELDRIAEEFKKLHGERQDLVSRWQVRIILFYNKKTELVEIVRGALCIMKILKYLFNPFSLFFL